MPVASLRERTDERETQRLRDTHTETEREREAKSAEGMPTYRDYRLDHLQSL